MTLSAVVNTRDSILQGAGVRSVLTTLPPDANLAELTSLFRVKKARTSFRLTGGVAIPASFPVVLVIDPSITATGVINWGTIAGSIFGPVSGVGATTGNIVYSAGTGPFWAIVVASTVDPVANVLYQASVRVFLYPATRAPVILRGDYGLWQDSLADNVFTAQLGSSVKYYDDVLTMGNGINFAVTKYFTSSNVWQTIAELQSGRLTVFNAMTSITVPSVIEGQGANNLTTPAQILSGTVAMPDAGFVYLAASIEQSYSGARPNWRVDIVINGVTVFTTGTMTTWKDRATFCFAAPTGYGDIPAVMYWYCDNPGGMLDYGEVICVGVLKLI